MSGAFHYLLNFLSHKMYLAHSVFLEVKNSKSSWHIRKDTDFNQKNIVNFHD